MQPPATYTWPCNRVVSRRVYLLDEFAMRRRDWSWLASSARSEPPPYGWGIRNGLDTENVGYSYDRVVALDAVSLSIPPGRGALLGPMGPGIDAPAPARRPLLRRIRHPPLFAASRSPKSVSGMTRFPRLPPCGLVFRVPIRSCSIPRLR